MNDLAPRKASPLVEFANARGLDTKGAWQMIFNTCISTKRGEPPPNADQVMACIIIANALKLDPLRREIYFFTDPRKGVIPIISVDGWLKMATNEPSYNGCEFESHHDQQGNLVAMTCTIWRKNIDHPFKVTEYLSECKRGADPWNNMPHRMLRHKAFMQCARVAFSISGCYDEDEGLDIIEGTSSPTPQIMMPVRKGEALPVPAAPTQRGSSMDRPTGPAPEYNEGEYVDGPPAEQQQQTSEEPQQQAQQAAPDGRKISDAQRKRLFAICRECGVDPQGSGDESLKFHLFDKYNIGSSADIRVDQYEAIVKWVESRRPA